MWLSGESQRFLPDIDPMEVPLMNYGRITTLLGVSLSLISGRPSKETAQLDISSLSQSHGLG